MNAMNAMSTRRQSDMRTTCTLGDLMSKRFPDREDLLGPWLRQGESVMLWAAPGTGKTLLTLTIALAVAGGGRFLGWHSPKPRKVLLVDGEMAAEDLQERLRFLAPTIEGFNLQAASENLTLYTRTLQRAEAGFPDLGERVGRGNEKAGQDDVMEAAMKCGAELILLDNFSTLSEVSDENDAAAMTPTLAFLMRLKQAKIGCVLVHHSGKSGDSYRGSSKLATTFEVIIGLTKIEGSNPADGAAFKLDWTKYRRKPCDAVRSRNVQLIEVDGQMAWCNEISLDDDVRVLLKAVRSGDYRTGKEIAAALQWAPSKVTTLKARAQEQKLITGAAWKDYLAAGQPDGVIVDDF